jgi:hypothetical protein
MSLLNLYGEMGKGSGGGGNLRNLMSKVISVY